MAVFHKYFARLSILFMERFVAKYYVLFVHKAAILHGGELIAQVLTSSWILHEPGQRGGEVKFCLKILLQICENFFKNAILGRVAFNKHFIGERAYFTLPPLNSWISLTHVNSLHWFKATGNWEKIQGNRSIYPKILVLVVFTSTSVQIGHP